MNSLIALFSTLLGMVECRLNCCLFQPVNNNMAVCGNGHGQIAVVNISTGKSSKVSYDRFKTIISDEF